MLWVCAIGSCFYVLTCCLVPTAGQVGGWKVLRWKTEPTEVGHAVNSIMRETDVQMDAKRKMSLYLARQMCFSFESVFREASP